MGRNRRQNFFFKAFAIAGRNFVRNECTTIAAAISFVFLLAIIPFSALFLFMLNRLQDLLLPGLWPQVNIVSWLILVLFFLITAKVFLATSIKLHHRLMAGALFGLLWIGARQCFGLYIQNVARINVLFGSLGSVCIVLLWIYYSSVALLYSVEFMYVLHCGPYKLWKDPSGDWT